MEAIGKMMPHQVKKYRWRPMITIASGHSTKDRLIPKAPTFALDYLLYLDNTHFLLWDVNVVLWRQSQYIGALDKRRKMRMLWVPKFLMDRMKRANHMEAPKYNTWGDWVGGPSSIHGDHWSPPQVSRAWMRTSTLQGGILYLSVVSFRSSSFAFSSSFVN